MMLIFYFNILKLFVCMWDPHEELPLTNEELSRWQRTETLIRNDEEQRTESETQQSQSTLNKEQAEINK